VSRWWLAALALALAGPARAQAPCGASGPSGFEPAAIDAGRRVLQVGPGRKLATPAAAASAARDGDVILIEAADYPDSRAVWSQSGLLLRGVNGRPRLIAGHTLAQGKAIWVIRGDEVVVENVEFSAARSPDHNGAGIRAEGRRLTVRGAYFHDNENGILTANDPEQQLTVEYSEFTRNGHENGLAHNLYVGSIARFEMRFSSSSGARTGHLVKSRARENLIEYNWIADRPAGPASYELDFPRSTAATVIGNLILQSEASPNATMLSYGAEDKGRAPTGSLRVAWNTFVSLRSRPVFIANRSPQPALVVNNVFGGAAGQDVRGAADADGNLTVPLSAFVDPRASEFRLRDSAGARSAAADTSSRPDLLPRFEPVPAAGMRRRPTEGHALPGAFGSCGGPASP
jgi:hypothetical protein